MLLLKKCWDVKGCAGLEIRNLGFESEFRDDLQIEEYE